MTWLVDARGGYSRRDLIREARSVATSLTPGRPVLVATTSVRATVVTMGAATHIGASPWLVGARRGRVDLAALVDRAGPGAVVVTESDLGVEGQREFSELLAGGAGRHTPRPRVPRPMVLHTSGTTGAPKAVTRRPPSPAALAQITSVLRRMPVRPRRLALATPPTHAHGLAAWMAAWASGAGVVDLHRLPPDEAVELLKVSGADGLTAVPSQLATWSLPSLRLIISGSDCLPTELVVRLGQGGAAVVNVYGMTETGPIALAGPRELARDPSAVGRLLAGVRVRVVDESGAEMPAGEQGVIEVRTPMLGRDRVVAADRGRLQGGLLSIDGRADGRVTRRGETVDREQAVEHLRARDGVSDVRSVQDGDDWVLRVTADSHLDAAALRTELAADLGPGLTPARIELDDPR